MAIELVGSGELGKLLGVGTARVQQLTRHKDFPAPIADLMMGKVWDLVDIRAWADSKGRELHPLGG